MTSAEYKRCVSEYTNNWDVMMEYFCRHEEYCCSSDTDRHGCCASDPSDTIALKYILIIAAAGVVGLLLFVTGICLLARKRRRKELYTPSAPPSAPPLADILPTYEEACGNVYTFR